MEAGVTSVEALAANKDSCAGFVDEWVQFCYDAGTVAVGLCRNGLLGFQDKHWQMKGHLGLAWRSLRSWEDGEPLDLRRPWPIGLFLAALSIALLYEWWTTATQLWLQFHCMLRPAEGCSLRWQDIVLAEDLADPVHASTAVVRVRAPKTARWGGRQQMVLLTDPWLVWWLRSLRTIFRVSPAQRLFLFTTATFNMRIARILTRLGLPPKSFTAAGLRAGGTTHLMRLGVQSEWLRHRGRWHSPHSMERYLQECGAVLADLSLPSAAKERIRSFADLALTGVTCSAYMLTERAAIADTAAGLISPFAQPTWVTKRHHRTK